MEGEFSEGRRSKLNRSGRGLGTWTAGERGFVANWHHAGFIRGEQSLQAVATCYRWISGEFVRSEEAADGDDVVIQMVGKPRDEGVGGPRGRIVLRPWPFPERLEAELRAGVNFVVTAFYEVRHATFFYESTEE